VLCTAEFQENMSCKYRIPRKRQFIYQRHS